jgi:hypothetical protein
MEQLRLLLQKFDSQWIKRRRVINTQLLLAAISSSSYNRHGIAHAALDIGIHPSAICRAQQKLPPHAFKNINYQFLSGCDDQNSERRIFALDGSKFYVPQSFTQHGYRTRTNNRPVRRCAKRPLAMLSSLIDVHTRRVYAYTITKHFNERKAVTDLLGRLHPGDTVICDRGYFSHSLYDLFSQRHINVLFRLKSDAFKAAKVFFQSKHTHTTINLISNTGQFMPIHLRKYKIGTSTYMFGFSPSLDKVDELYRKRWEVELSFRRLKSNLNLNYTFALSPRIWEQHVEARILLDTVSVMPRREIDNQPKQVERRRLYPKRACYLMSKVLLAFSNIKPSYLVFSCCLFGDEGIERYGITTKYERVR